MPPEQLSMASGLKGCPTTNQVKGFPFKVALPVGLQIKGVVLIDQIKSLDWWKRQFSSWRSTKITNKKSESRDNSHNSDFIYLLSNPAIC